MWKRVALIKKMYAVELSSANNFTVNLDLLGLGTWDKDKVRVFSTISSISMHPSDRGLDVSVTRKSGTNIYEVSAYTNRVDMSKFKDTVFTNRNTWNNVMEESDTSYTMILVNATSAVPGSTGDGYAYMKAQYDGMMVINEKVSRYDQESDIFAHGLSTWGAYKGNRSKQISVMAQYSSFGQKMIVRQFKYKTVKNTDTKIQCLFVEGDI